MSARRRASRAAPGVLVRGVGLVFSAPVLLGMALVLGGASRGAFAVNGVLQAIAGLVLAATLILPARRPIEPAFRVVLGLAGCLLAICALQLVPLPPKVWSALPARAEIAEAFALMGRALPPMPLSLSPQETMLGLGRCLPPLAILVCALRIRAMEEGGGLRWVIVSIAALSCMLGVLQVLTGRDGGLYFYDVTNWGQPVGFMANVNHQACFLLMAMPFLAATAARLEVRYGMGDSDFGLVLLISLMAALLVLGVMVAGSMAGYLMLAPTLVVSVLVFRRRAPGPIGLLGLVLGSGIVAGLGFLVASSPVLVGLGMTQMDLEDRGPLGRPSTFERTGQAIEDTFPVGSGFGSFERFFPRYEDPDTIPAAFVNHAHNDYLEVVLELGAPGLVLIVAALAWILWRTVRVWRAGEEESARLGRAASVALGVVCLHSLVDYPLRTGAIACLAALCLVFLGQARVDREPSVRRASRAAPEEAARHVEL